VWRNERGGLTFRIGARYAKWAPVGSGLDLAAEAARLAWASAWTPVPAVLEQGGDDEGTWLVTAALPGRNAVEPRWLERPAVAARAIGSALRSLHDALPVDACPFDWSVPERLATSRR